MHGSGTDEEHGQFDSPPVVVPSKSSHTPIVTLTLFTAAEFSKGPQVAKPALKSKTRKRTCSLLLC